MRIPEIRKELAEISGRLAVLADELNRRSGPRAPSTSERIDAELAATIRKYAKTFPDMTQADIGRVFNVNQGRVSEAIRGKRT